MTPEYAEGLHIESRVQQGFYGGLKASKVTVHVCIISVHISIPPMQIGLPIVLLSVVILVLKLPWLETGQIFQPPILVSVHSQMTRTQSGTVVSLTHQLTGRLG